MLNKRVLAAILLASQLDVVGLWTASRTASQRSRGRFEKPGKRGIGYVPWRLLWHGICHSRGGKGNTPPCRRPDKERGRKLWITISSRVIPGCADNGIPRRANALSHGQLIVGVSTTPSVWPTYTSCFNQRQHDLGHNEPVRRDRIQQNVRRPLLVMRMIIV